MHTLSEYETGWKDGHGAAAAAQDECVEKIKAALAEAEASMTPEHLIAAAYTSGLIDAYKFSLSTLRT